MTAAVSGPLWNAVGGADNAAGAVAPPTGVIMPEANIAGTKTKGGTKVSVVVYKHKELWEENQGSATMKQW